MGVAECWSCGVWGFVLTTCPLSFVRSPILGQKPINLHENLKEILGNTFLTDSSKNQRAFAFDFFPLKYNFFCRPTSTTPIISTTLSATKTILVIYISLISYYNLDKNLFICYTQLKRVFNAKKYIVSFMEDRLLQ